MEQSVLKNGFRDMFSLYDVTDVSKFSFFHSSSKKGAIMRRQDIIVYPDKTIIVKRIYDIDQNINDEAKKNQIVDLVYESSLTNQSVHSSRNITHVVGRSVAVDMIIHDNLKGLITQAY